MKYDSLWPWRVGRRSSGTISKESGLPLLPVQEGDTTSQSVPASIATPLEPPPGEPVPRRQAGWQRRAALIALGHTAKRIEEYLFDWLLYGLVVAACTTTWGPYHGSLIAFFIMTPLSACVCLSYLALYMWAQKDWLGLEALRDLQCAMPGEGFFSRLLRRIVRLGNVPAFFALSLYGDPFMTTVYLRQGGQQYGKLSGRDMDVFWLSVIVSNAYWTLRWTIIVEVLILVWARYKDIVLGPS